jgi:hypothetical protein
MLQHAIHSSGLEPKALPEFLQADNHQNISCFKILLKQHARFWEGGSDLIGVLNAPERKQWSAPKRATLPGEKRTLSKQNL